MKKIIAVTTVALVPFISACADSPTAFSDDAMFSRGVASPNTTVTVTLSVQTAGYWLGGGVDANRAPNSTCVEVDGVPGYFKNPSGNVSGGQNAGQCWVGSGTAQNITFDVGANHVRPASGNEQLNFGSICDDDSVCLSTDIHYTKNQNRSRGQGRLLGEGYMVDLSGIDQAGNVLATKPVMVTACPSLGGSCVGAALTW